MVPLKPKQKESQSHVLLTKQRTSRASPFKALANDPATSCDDAQCDLESEAMTHGNSKPLVKTKSHHVVLMILSLKLHNLKLRCPATSADVLQIAARGSAFPRWSGTLEREKCGNRKTRHVGRYITCADALR